MYLSYLHYIIVYIVKWEFFQYEIASFLQETAKCIRATEAHFKSSALAALSILPPTMWSTLTIQI